MRAQVRLTLVAVSLSACLTPAQAETQDLSGSLVRQELCAPGAPEVQSKIPLDGPPVYFDRNVPNGSGVVVAFANQDGTQSNYLIDLKSGKKSQIPGIQDGIPSPDGEIYTTPYMQ